MKLQYKPRRAVPTVTPLACSEFSAAKQRILVIHCDVTMALDTGSIYCKYVIKIIKSFELLKRKLYYTDRMHEFCLHALI